MLTPRAANHWLTVVNMLQPLSMKHCFISPFFSFHFDSYFPDMGIASLVNSETCLSFLLMPHFSMYFRKTPQFLCISLQSVCCMLWLQEDSAEHTTCLCLTFSQNTLLGSSKDVTCLSSFINYFICINCRTNTIRFFISLNYKSTKESWVEHFKLKCVCACVWVSYLPHSAVWLQPVVDLSPAVSHAGHGDWCLTENQSFPFQQTHPVLSAINRGEILKWLLWLQ